MSIEQAIHNRWAGDPVLIALVPAARFVTGKVLGGAAMPYATLARLGTRQSTRTSSRTVETIEIEFNAWTMSLETGKDIAEAITARFDRQSFTDGGVTILRMRQTDAQAIQADDGKWRLALRFSVTR